MWGAAPQTAVPGEADFADEARAAQAVRRAVRGRSSGSTGPETINIRRGIEVTPRTAKKPAETATPNRSSRRSRTSRRDGTTRSK